MEHNVFLSDPIAPPLLSDRMATVVVLLTVGTLSEAMTAPGTAGKWVLAPLALLLFLAIVRKAVYATHIALLSVIWVIAFSFIPLFRQWPFNPLVPLAVYSVSVVLTPQLRRSVGWLRAGHFGPSVRLMVIATAIVSCAALVLWTVLAKPDLRHHLAHMPEMPLWLYPFAAIGFAVFNAAVEEIIFRGIIMEALDSALGETYSSIVVQAVSFAAMHYVAGFPNGVWGFLMVAVYGIMLGMIRRRAKGLLAPTVAHVAADLAIFVILAVILKA